MMTPYDKLKSLPNAKDYLKPDINFEILDEIATNISDNEAADQLQLARQKLFTLIMNGSKKTAWQITLFQTHFRIGIYYSE